MIITVTLYPMGSSDSTLTHRAGGSGITPASQGSDRTGNLVRAWLAEQGSTNTRTAYRKDVDRFAAFLSEHGVTDVLETRRAMAAAWSDSMRATVREDGARVISEATIARRLAAVSSFLTYAVEVEAIEANPIAKMKRPKLSADSDGIVWLDTAEMKTFLAAAALHSPRAHALAALMLTTGARVSEVLAADVDDLGHTGGHRVLTVTRKGGKRQNLPIAPWVGRVLDDWLADRTDGPLFATAARAGGHGRLDQPAVHRLIRKIAAAAGLPNAETLHPHSLRHSAITGALEAGGSLRDVQAMAGHVDPRTTERYDRMRGRLDASPVYALAAALATA